MTREIRHGEYSDEFYDDETGETWTEEDDTVAECERCGEKIRDADESLAVVTADGKVKHWCRSCLHPAYEPESLIEDIIEAVGAFGVYGYADDNDEACRGAAERMKVTGGVHG